MPFTIKVENDFQNREKTPLSDHQKSSPSSLLNAASASTNRIVFVYVEYLLKKNFPANKHLLRIRYVRYAAVAQWLSASNIFQHCVSQHLSGAGSSPAGSVGRDLNLQKLNYQYLTTSVAVVLVVRWYFNGYLVLFCVQCCVCRKRQSSPSCRSVLIESAWVVIVPGQKMHKKNKIK